MKRRRLLQIIAALPVMRGLWRWGLAPAEAASSPSTSRVRPGDPAWPSQAEWDQLAKDVGGRLLKVTSPLSACIDAPSYPACARVFKELKNPLFPRRRARAHAIARLGRRLDVGPERLRGRRGHNGRRRGSRQFRPRAQFAAGRERRWAQLSGKLQRADSLLIWTRAMNDIVLHDAFVPDGLRGKGRAGSRRSPSGRARSGCTFTTRSRPKRAATCKAAAARQSASRD